MFLFHYLTAEAAACPFSYKMHFNEYECDLNQHILMIRRIKKHFKKCQRSKWPDGVTNVLDTSTVHTNWKTHPEWPSFINYPRSILKLQFIYDNMQQQT